MRARLSTLTGLAALALLLPITAGAQGTAAAAPKKDYSQPGHWTFVPFAGWTVFDPKFGEDLHGDNTLKPDDAIHGGARLGYVWGRDQISLGVRARLLRVFRNTRAGFR